jgi:hypothetical protein
VIEKPALAPIDPLRPEPPGMPTAGELRPPVLAESGDPFAAIRVIELVARLPRGRAVALAAIVDRLNSSLPDWLFDARVVADALVQLQANWMSDYRNTTGIVIDDEDGRTTVLIEDSSRVDPWIVRQAERQLARCREALDAFSRRDRPAGEG